MPRGRHCATGFPQAAQSREDSTVASAALFLILFGMTGRTGFRLPPYRDRRSKLSRGLGARGANWRRLFAILSASFISVACCISWGRASAGCCSSVWHSRRSYNRITAEHPHLVQVKLLSRGLRRKMVRYPAQTSSLFFDEAGQ